MTQTQITLSCPKCRSPIREGVRFCTRCGATVEPQALRQAPANKAATVDANNDSPHTRRGKSGAWTFLTLLAIIAGVVGWRQVFHAPTDEEFIQAVRRDDTAAVQRMLASTPQLANAKHTPTAKCPPAPQICFDGNTYYALHTAVASHDLKIVQHLLNSGANADARTGDGLTALDTAIADSAGERPDPEIVRLLLDRSSHPKFNPVSLDLLGISLRSNPEHYKPETQARKREIVILLVRAGAKGLP